MERTNLGNASKSIPPLSTAFESDSDISEDVMDKIPLIIGKGQDKIDNSSSDSDQNTEKEFKPDVSNPLIPIVELIIMGYNRRFRRSIPEIDNLCIAYYGADTRKLIHFREHGNWFYPIISDHPILMSVYNNSWRRGGGIEPLTQYIVENVQIAYGHILGFQWIEWSGFLCIDLRTRSVQKLLCGINGKPVGRKDLSEFNGCDIEDAESLKNEDEEKRFDLMLSGELSESLTKHTRWDRQEKQKNEEYGTWTLFTENLWSMFILNKLYIPSADDDYMRKQPIWRVIQFLFVLYFAEKLQTGVIVPQIHFDATWPFPDRASSNREYGGWRNRYKCSEDEEKMKMDTGIIRYQKGVSMQAVCYLSVDWGGGYWTFGGYNRNLYLATFDISKQNDNSEVVFRMDFEVAKSIQRYGTAMS